MGKQEKNDFFLFQPQKFVSEAETSTEVNFFNFSCLIQVNWQRYQPVIISVSLPGLLSMYLLTV